MRVRGAVQRYVERVGGVPQVGARRGLRGQRALLQAVALQRRVAVEALAPRQPHRARLDLRHRQRLRRLRLLCYSSYDNLSVGTRTDVDNNYFVLLEVFLKNRLIDILERNLYGYTNYDY